LLLAAKGNRLRREGPCRTGIGSGISELMSTPPRSKIQLHHPVAGEGRRCGRPRGHPRSHPGRGLHSVAGFDFPILGRECVWGAQGKVLGLLLLLPPCRLVSQSVRESGFDLCKRQGVGLKVSAFAAAIEAAVTLASLNAVQERAAREGSPVRSPRATISSARSSNGRHSVKAASPSAGSPCIDLSLGCQNYRHGLRVDRLDLRVRGNSSAKTAQL
jgi:hypothetical protein